MNETIASRIETIEYRADEIKSLMIALEDGIFGNNWDVKCFQMGYSCVFNMMSDLHESLNNLKNELFSNSK